MRLELAIDELRVPGISPRARDELARALEEELDHLVRTHGLPFGREVGEVEIDEAALACEPGESIGEVAAALARQLVAGLHLEATGRVPEGLREAAPGERR